MTFDFDKTFHPTRAQEIERVKRLLKLLKKVRRKNPQNFCDYLINTAENMPLVSNPSVCSRTGEICNKKCKYWIDNGLIRYQELYLKDLIGGIVRDNE